MGVAVLNPQDCLKHPLFHMKHPPSACPNNRQKKPVSNNRTRRSPPRKQTTRSPPVAPTPLAAVPNGTAKKSPSNNIRILKRGEEIPKKTSDPVVEKPDLVSTRRIGPDPKMIPSQIRLGHVRKSKTAPFYAGPVTMTSPPPSDVPLPAFFAAKKSATDATSELIRMLRIDIAA